MHKLFLHVHSSMNGWTVRRLTLYGIIVDVVILQEFLYIPTVKFLSSVSMQIFWTSSIVSNYLCVCTSALGFKRHDPCMLTQDIDNDENIVVTSVESHIRTHLDHIRLALYSCTMTCLRGKSLLDGACNSLTSFLDIANYYSARCTSRIIFSGSFNIACIIYKAAIFLSILFRQSFKS